MAQVTPTVVLVAGVRHDPEAPAVPAGDPGLLGQGVYESIRTYAGRPFALDRHLERLAAGAVALEIPVPSALAEEVTRAVALLREEGHRGEARVRVVLTAGGARVVSADPLPDRSRDREAGVRAVVLPWPKDPAGATAGLKATSTAGTRVAQRLVRERDAATGLWLTPAGRVCEALAANVFVVRAGVVATPPLGDGPLAGVTRALLLEWARAEGLPVEEASFTVGDLGAAEEAFLSATSEPVVPLVAVDDVPVADGRPGPVTRALQEAFARRAAAWG